MFANGDTDDDINVDTGYNADNNADICNAADDDVINNTSNFDHHNICDETNAYNYNLGATTIKNNDRGYSNNHNNTNNNNHINSNKNDNGNVNDDVSRSLR